MVDAPARLGEGISASAAGIVNPESKSDGRVSDSVELLIGNLFASDSGRACFGSMAGSCGGEPCSIREEPSWEFLSKQRSLRSLCRGRSSEALG